MSPGEKRKTLILNGSPRAAGDTMSLVNLLTAGLEGEYRLVNAYSADISPCVDCRYCWKKPGCAIKDGMQELYGYIEDCDSVVIASPVYFSELTGKLLGLVSRLQTYYCAKRFRHEEVKIKEKRGAVILVGGGDGKIDRAYETARTILRHVNCRDIHELVYSHSTNKIPAIDDRRAVSGVKDIIKFLNE